VRDIGREYDLEAVRMFMLSAHYRSPVNFSRELVEQAESSLERLYIARDHLAFLLTSAIERPPNGSESAFIDQCDRTVERFHEAMDDDLNTADALGAVFELVREIHKLPQGEGSRQAITYGQQTLSKLTGVLGLLMRRADDMSPEVQALVDQRAEARKSRDWKRSDQLRDAIKALGYILEDTPGGQKVRKGV